MTEIVYARAVSLMEAEIEDEIVGLDRSQGEVFGFNSVASDVWRLLETPRTASQICAEMAERYEVSADECSGDVRDLLDELIKLNLVKRIQGA